MRKAPPIVIHRPEGWPSASLAERMAMFHADCIERRLERMDSLTVEQKIEVIDGIVRNLKRIEEVPRL